MPATAAAAELYGPYQIDTDDQGVPVQLGAGAFGTIYRATDTSDPGRRTVALKLIPGGLAGQPGVRDRFLAETGEQSRLDHPRIVHVFGAGEQDGYLYFGMDYCSGGDLGEYVRKHGPLTAAEALKVGRAVADALVYAHGHLILHRDLKPSNILLEKAGSLLPVKLSDFGLVKRTWNGDSVARSKSGGFAGTIQFSSPEQIKEETLDARSDIYSLGLTLWHVLAGAFPLTHPDGSALNQWELMQEHTSPAEFTDRLPAAWPECLRELIGKMIARHRAGRFENCGQLVIAIEKCQQALGAGPAAAMRPAESAVPMREFYSTDGFGKPRPLGTSYDAKDLRTGKRVEIITLNPGLAADDQRALRHHVSLLRQAPHPNLSGVKLRDFRDGIVLVRELNEDCITLQEWIGRPNRPRTLPEVAPLLIQLASALDHASALGLPGTETDPRLISVIQDAAGGLPSAMLTPRFLVLPEEADAGVEENAGMTLTRGHSGPGGSAVQLSPAAALASLAYWIIASRGPAAWAFMNTGAYVPVDRLKRTGNEVLRNAIAGQSSSQAVETLRQLCAAESIPFTWEIPDIQAHVRPPSTTAPGRPSTHTSPVPPASQHQNLDSSYALPRPAAAFGSTSPGAGSPEEILQQALLAMAESRRQEAERVRREHEELLVRQRLEQERAAAEAQAEAERRRQAEAELARQRQEYEAQREKDRLAREEERRRREQAEHRAAEIEAAAKARADAEAAEKEARFETARLEVERERDARRLLEEQLARLSKETEELSRQRKDAHERATLEDATARDVAEAARLAKQEARLRDEFEAKLLEAQGNNQRLQESLAQAREAAVHVSTNSAEQARIAAALEAEGRSAANEAERRARQIQQAREEAQKLAEAEREQLQLVRERREAEEAAERAAAERARAERAAADAEERRRQIMEQSRLEEERLAEKARLRAEQEAAAAAAAALRTEEEEKAAAFRKQNRNSPRKQAFIVVLAVLVTLGGGAAWYFYGREKPLPPLAPLSLTLSGVAREVRYEPVALLSDDFEIVTGRKGQEHTLSIMPRPGRNVRAYPAEIPLIIDGFQEAIPLADGQSGYTAQPNARFEIVNKSGTGCELVLLPQDEQNAGLSPLQISGDSASTLQTRLPRGTYALAWKLASVPKPWPVLKTGTPPAPFMVQIPQSEPVRLTFAREFTPYSKEKLRLNDAFLNGDKSYLESAEEKAPILGTFDLVFEDRAALTDSAIVLTGPSLDALQEDLYYPMCRFLQLVDYIEAIPLLKVQVEKQGADFREKYWTATPANRFLMCGNAADTGTRLKVFLSDFRKLVMVLRTIEKATLTVGGKLDTVNTTVDWHTWFNVRTHPCWPAMRYYLTQFGHYNVPVGKDRETELDKSIRAAQQAQEPAQRRELRYGVDGGGGIVELPADYPF